MRRLVLICTHGSRHSYQLVTSWREKPSSIHREWKIGYREWRGFRKHEMRPETLTMRLCYTGNRCHRTDRCSTAVPEVQKFRSELSTALLRISLCQAGALTGADCFHITRVTLFAATPNVPQKPLKKPYFEVTGTCNWTIEATGSRTSLGNIEMI